MLVRHSVCSSKIKPTIYIGMGSNLGYPIAQLKRAVREINLLPQTHVMKVSSLYYSEPVGPRFQPWYYNRVIAIASRMKPLRLLRALQKIENKHRRKHRKHWGPRTLDLDILLFGQSSMRYKQLTVPHLQMVRRAFVIMPLAEIAADLAIPNHGKITDIASKFRAEDLVKVMK